MNAISVLFILGLKTTNTGELEPPSLPPPPRNTVESRPNVVKVNNVVTQMY